jgi:biotin carboxyl carrier protein
MTTQRAVQPGAVVAHLVAVGDTVTGGAPVLVVETMKFETVVLAEVPGTVTAIAPLGEIVAVGTELCAIADEAIDLREAARG